MGQTLTLAMIGFALLFFALLFHRVRQLAFEDRHQCITGACSRMIYLASVLILLWLFVGGYLVFMLVRQRTMEKALRSLEERLQDREQGG